MSLALITQDGDICSSSCTLMPNLEDVDSADIWVSDRGIDDCKENYNPGCLNGILKEMNLCGARDGG